MKIYLRILITLILFTKFLNAQSVSVNSDGSPSHSSAILDVKHPNKGLLLPRVALTGTNDTTTIPSPALSLLIYNTVVSGAGTTAITVGFYYWNGTRWTSLSTGTPWQSTGNAGTKPDVNFLGTSDNNPLAIKVNNIRAGYIGLPVNDGNVFLGYESGLSTTGKNNVGLGTATLYSNTTQSNLVAIGDSALFNNRTGLYNTGLGSKTLLSNVSGNFNTATGAHALLANTSGTYNTATGAFALYFNNVGPSNTANGAYALYANTTGNANSAFGNYALMGNKSGSVNTAIGKDALGANVSGNHNTATGAGALGTNTTGSYNIANGSYSLNANTTGNYNNAFGWQSAYLNTSGDNNTALGYQSLYYSSIGNFNTAIGNRSLFFNSAGTYNTALGYGADVAYGDFTNATALGNGALVNASNKVRIGNAAVTVIEGQVAYSFPSDGRFKYNIEKNVPGLDFITKLTPVTYYFDEEKLTEYTATGILNNSTVKPASFSGLKILHTGFVAQDVERITRQLGYNFDGVHAPVNDKDHYSLAYSQFVMPLVKAVQELNEKIKNLQEEANLLRENKTILCAEPTIITFLMSQQKEIIELKENNDELKARLEKLERFLK